jgi:hypothetical protein
LQVDAALQLAQLSMHAGQERAAARSLTTDFRPRLGLARHSPGDSQGRVGQGSDGAKVPASAGRSSEATVDVEATTAVAIAAEADVEEAVPASPEEVQAAQPARPQVNPQLVGPQRAPELGSATVVTYCRAVEQGTGFYDFVPLSADRLGLVIGNISDPAGDGSSRRDMARRTLCTWLRSSPDPLAALCGANDELSSNLGGNCSASVALAIVDPRSRAVRMARAGHPPPVVHRPAQRPPFLRFDGTGYAMGTNDRRQFQRSLKPCVVVATPGDGLLLYTETLVKAENLAGEEFGMGNVFMIVDQLRDEPPESLLTKLVEEWDAYTDGVPQPDDLAAIFVRFKPA